MVSRRGRVRNGSSPESESETDSPPARQPDRPLRPAGAPRTPPGSCCCCCCRPEPPPSFGRAPPGRGCRRNISDLVNGSSRSSTAAIAIPARLSARPDRPSAPSSSSSESSSSDCDDRLGKLNPFLGRWWAGFVGPCPVVAVVVVAVVAVAVAVVVGCGTDEPGGRAVKVGLNDGFAIPGWCVLDGGPIRPGTTSGRLERPNQRKTKSATKLKQQGKANSRPLTRRPAHVVL